MPKILIVAEKPDVGRSLAAALLGRSFSGMGPHRGTLPTGEELTVTTARGHLFELAPPQAYDPKYAGWVVHDLPITPTTRWDFQQVAREDAANYIQILRREIAEHLTEEIVNACDAGREGEVIFRKVMRGCGAKKTATFTRMWAQVMTEEGLREAFAQRAPSANYNGLGEAGFSRDEADWLVGMNVTVLATKTLPRGRGNWKVWSVGRVQTPTLALVDTRDRLIADFKPQPFWEAYGTFGPVEAKADLDAYADSPDRPKLLGSPEVNTERSKKVFWSKEKAAAFETSAKAPASYSISDKKGTRSEKPPLPFDLQEVQKLCSKRLGLTGTESLAILQDLYEKRKLLSYPRTDSRYLPTKLKTKLHADLVRVLEEVKVTHPNLHLVSQPMMPAEIAAKARAFDDTKVSDHFGIVPTGETAAIRELSGHELFVFLAVLQTTLMALDEPARYKTLTRRYTQEGGAGPYAPAVFRTTREEVESPGFTRWRKEPADAKRPAPLPASDSTQATLDAVTLKELRTNPPEPYTDATLLDAMKYAGESVDPDLSPEQADALIEVMKDRGIGTPATRAGIIDKLVARQFLERQGKTIVTTENGRQLIRELRLRAPDFLSAQLTAEWELVLKQMERGEAKLNRAQFLDALLEQVETLKKAFIEKTSRNLEATAVAVTEGVPVDAAVCPKSRQPLLDRGPFLEAPGFPGLKLWKRAFGKDFSAADYVALLTAIAEGKPFHATGLKSGQGREFEADLVLNAEGTKLEFHRPEPKKVKGVKCPKSGKLLLDHGIYFEATGWPGVRLYKTAFGRAFTAEDYLPILEGWKTGTPIVVENLVSAKSGKIYSARLVVDSTNKVRLDFGSATQAG
jgi:DNA topoisomerase-3